MESALIVTADDYGYARGYDAGMIEAAAAGAVDAVSVMVGEGRWPDAAALLVTGVEIGLHLELGPDLLGGELSRPSGTGHAGPSARAAAIAELERQLEAFERLFDRPAAYVDGHGHCHAAAGLGAAIGRASADQGLPVRSVSARHRRTLRCLGVTTQDRLVGRVDESEPLPPPEVGVWLETGVGPSGVTEWLVHPGHPDESSGSSYDAGRAEDLELLLGLARKPALVSARTTHAEALG